MCSTIARRSAQYTIAYTSAPSHAHTSTNVSTNQRRHRALFTFVTVHVNSAANGSVMCRIARVNPGALAGSRSSSDAS